MNRGLASLPTQRFQSGGPAIGLGGLTAPAVSIGPIGVTPADIGIAALSAMNAPVAAPLAAVNTAINALNALSAMNAAHAAANAPASSTPAEGDIAAAAQEATDAVDAAEGLAAMNAANAQAQAAEDAATTSAAQTAAMVDAVNDAEANAAAVDAAAAAAAAAATAGGDGGGGGGGVDGAGGAGPGAGVGGSADSSGDGTGGERAGGLIGRKHYQFGGSVMGMGDAAPRYAYAPIMMAEGGLAAAAQNVQSRGRGNDTMLVHMTPGEVKGLQALAMAQGGSLTINPDTGLPEAGILSSLLPIVAGFALGPAGFQLMSAGMAGLTVGGLTTLATGSLKKGIMAGLGAYGGAGLGEGLVGTTTPTTPPPTVEQAFAPKPTAFEQLLAPKPTPGVTSTYGPDAILGKAGELPKPQLGFGNIGAGPTTAQIVAPPVPTTSMLAAPPVPGVSQAMPITADTAVSTAITPAAPMSGKDLFKYGSAALAPILGQEPQGPTPSPAFIRPYKFTANPIQGAYTPSPTPGDTSERRYFEPTFTPLPIYRAAEGGQIDPDYDMNIGQSSAFSDNYAPGGSVKGLDALAKKRRSLMGDSYYKFADDRRDKSMEAAIDQNFAQGGALPPRFLSGGGDGMSDSIKANIDGKQEARLADGEFVVPADVVSHLGNGSSKAGAKKLYAMMDKIRKARTGSKRQAPEVNAAKYMPA